MSGFDETIQAAAEEIIGLIGYGFTEDTREQVDTILRRHFAGLEAEQWRPIATAPKDGTTVIGGSLRNGWSREVWWSRDQNQWYGVGGIHYPTHWRPLPPPPKEADHD